MGTVGAVALDKAGVTAGCGDSTAKISVKPSRRWGIRPSSARATMMAWRFPHRSGEYFIRLVVGHAAFARYQGELW